MSGAERRIEVRTYDDPDVVALVAAVQQEYVRRYGGPDAAVVEVDEFAPPQGIFLVGLDVRVPVASGGWRRVSTEAVEIKRMYVDPRARGRGWARAILAELEERARAAGAVRALLNTGTQQPEAIALYESSGYSPAPGYGIYANSPGALFYAKPL